MQEKQRVERQTKDGKLIRKLEKGNLKSFLEDWYQQPLFKTIKKAKSFKSIMMQRLDNDPEELIKSLRMMGVGVQPSLWKACASIHIPVLLLTGEFDRKFSNIILDMKKLNQDFELAFVKNAGHNVHVEQPLEYLQYLKKFLNNVRESYK
jgi:2-succinyl-6-hydroxy-2,4-cyclohexadiene-1-carboxylate synthase